MINNEEHAMSKYTLFAFFALLSSFCGLLKAAEQQYPFDFIDRVIFRVVDDSQKTSDNRECIKALYSTAFINSVPAEIGTTIERESLFSVFKSATTQKKRGCSVLYPTEIGASNKKDIILQAYDRVRAAEAQVIVAYTFFFSPNDTITMADSMILLLLQLSVQKIKRTAGTVEITLRVNNEFEQKTFVAPPMLAQFMEKYRAYENKDMYGDA
jgi:hypothetical protein